MIARCHKPNNHEYRNYGGRGIRVCEEWLRDYSKFESWALANGFSPELSIDRIDVNKGYSPDNCRWTDARTQANNKTTNMVFFGESHTATEWAEITGISYNTIQARKVYGWPDARILHPEIYPSAHPPAGTTLLKCPQCGGNHVRMRGMRNNILCASYCYSCHHYWPNDAQSFRAFATRPGVEGINATNLALFDYLGEER